MTDELSRLAPEILIVGLICAAIVASVVSVQWGRVRRQDAELELTRHLVDQRIPVEEIKQLLALRAPPVKGVLEQFGTLGPGSKAGLLFLAFMALGIVMGVVQSYIFWVARAGNLMTAGSPTDPPLPELSAEWYLDVEPGVETPDVETPVAEAAAPPPGPAIPPVSSDVPPSPEQLIEAMLFVGGRPLSAETASAAIRGLTSDRFHVAIDSLTRRYRQQRRPYGIQPRDGGFVLNLLSIHRGLRERLFGGPRETRLGQPALDVLSVVAYRQPVGKAEVDAIRGTESGAILRHLVRLGLVAVQHRAEAGIREVRYGTTPRFLLVFGLASLDELPRLGDTSQV